MSIAQLLQRPPAGIAKSCTILRRIDEGDRDGYGNELPTEHAVETVCYVEQRQRAEPDLAGEFSDTEWLAVFPVDTELRTGDGVEIEGLGELEVTGDPWQADAGSVAVDHVEATLRQTKGSDDADEDGS